MVALLDKLNGMGGMLGFRLVHIVCTFWKFFFSGPPRKNRTAKDFDNKFGSYAHGFLRGRREEAMGTQRTMGYRLDVAQVPHKNDLIDMT